MTWTTPKIVEVCVGMEVTSYEFRRNLGAAIEPPGKCCPSFESAGRLFDC